MSVHYLGKSQIIRGTKLIPAQPSEGCPYPLPKGCKLVRFEKKFPPVAVTVCSVVTDIEKFIRHALSELDARLHHPHQIKAGDSVFEILSKLADCGLELRLEWEPPRIIQDSPDSEVPKVPEPVQGQQIICDPPEIELTKPTKLPEASEPDPDDGDIPDEEVPF